MCPCISSTSLPFSSFPIVGERSKSGYLNTASTKRGNVFLQHARIIQSYPWLTAFLQSKSVQVLLSHAGDVLELAGSLYKSCLCR